MLVRPRDIAEVWWIGLGALLLVLLRLIPARLAVKAVAEGSDVYLFLFGMMLVSELARENGVFDWVSYLTVREARSDCGRLFTLVYLVGTIVTIFLSNDATAVVLTPAVLSAIRKAKVEPLPYLFACAMIANAASFFLPISNPANLVVFHTGMPTLGRWLASFALPSGLSITANYFVLRFYFRKELLSKIGSKPEETKLDSNGRLVLSGLAFMVAVLLAATSFHMNLGLPTCLAALLITALVSTKEKSNPLILAKGIGWATLLLVAGLFVMVKAVESLGALHYTQAALGWAQHLPAAAGALLVSFVIGAANNLVNNLPLGLMAGATVEAAHLRGLLTNAVLVGVDLGPNLSVTGSLATILWLLALRKEKLNVSAWSFLKVGLLAMPLAMLAAVAGLIASHVFTGQ
jgi:arsenical pump membrane protein